MKIIKLSLIIIIILSKDIYPGDSEASIRWHKMTPDSMETNSPIKYSNKEKLRNLPPESLYYQAYWQEAPPKNNGELIYAFSDALVKYFLYGLNEKQLLSLNTITKSFEQLAKILKSSSNGFIEFLQSEKFNNLTDDDKEWILIKLREGILTLYNLKELTDDYLKYMLGETILCGFVRMSLGSVYNLEILKESISDYIKEKSINELNKDEIIHILDIIKNSNIENNIIRNYWLYNLSLRIEDQIIERLLKSFQYDVLTLTQVGINSVNDLFKNDTLKLSLIVMEILEAKEIDKIINKIKQVSIYKIKQMNILDDSMKAILLLGYLMYDKNKDNITETLNIIFDTNDESQIITHISDILANFILQEGFSNIDISQEVKDELRGNLLIIISKAPLIIKSVGKFLNLFEDKLDEGMLSSPTQLNSDSSVKKNKKNMILEKIIIILFVLIFLIGITTTIYLLYQGIFALWILIF